MLKKFYTTIEESAKQLCCTPDELLQFASYGQIELCVLIPRQRVSAVIYSEDNKLLEFDRSPIAAIHCGPCALYPLQWRAFLANREIRTYSIKWIYAGYPGIERYQQAQGFKDWLIVPDTHDETPIRISECTIVVRQEEIERILSEQQTGRKITAISDNTLISTIAALLAAFPKGKPPSGKDLERAAQCVGVSVSDDSIRKALALAREIAPSLKSA